MNRKLDSELTVLRKEIRKEIKKSIGTTTTTNPSFVRSYGFVSGGSGMGGNEGIGAGTPAGSIIFIFFGGDGSPVGVTSEWPRTKFEAKGMLYLYDNSGADSGEIYGEVMASPMYWMTLGM